MSASNESGLLDLLVLIVKWKKLLISVTLGSILLGYLAVYFFVEVEYSATTTILPREDRSFSALTGIKKGLSGIPTALGGKIQGDDMDFFTTIVYSRTALTQLIDKFHLDTVYKTDKSNPAWKENLIVRLRKDIEAKESKNASFDITITSTRGQLASDMANYLVEILNLTVIKTQSQKSHDNRIFLEERVKETRLALKQSEDSLRMFQETSGVFEPKEQTSLMLETFSDLENKLISKEIEKSIAERIFEKGSPKMEMINAELEEYKKRLVEGREKNKLNSLFGRVSSIPSKSQKYVSLYREVSLNNSVLEFIIPLYEQAKFDEQRDIPMLNIIDKAIPPVKKSFPPRTVFALLIGFGAFLIALLSILISESEKFKNSEKIGYIKQNLFTWRSGK